MLNNILSILGMSAKRTVGVSISPGIGLEMIDVDKLTGTVSKYGNRKLEYNSSTREIADYEAFQTALDELFDELNISKKSNVVFSLPNVFFGLSELPMLLTEDAVSNALISEAEQSYIFKRQDPVVSWCCIDSNEDSEVRVYAYSAIQKSVIDNINDVCNEIGCTPVAIESSYSSLFRTLYYSQLAKEQMQDKASWNLVVVGQNNYSILALEGKKVISYTEEPLALKSFVDDEIYNAIKASAQLTLSNLLANYLFIVSETDLVSAEVLSLKLQVDCPVKFLECNKYTQNEIIPVNLDILPKVALQITPEAIGTALFYLCDFPLKLNILQNQEEVSTESTQHEEGIKVHIGGFEVELTKSLLQKLFIVLLILIIVPLGGIYFFFRNTLVPQEQSKLTDLDSKAKGYQGQIDQYKAAENSTAFDPKSTIRDILDKNKTKLSYYDAIGVSIPNNLWITEFTIKDDNKVDIKGKAGDVQNVYAFYKSIKQLVDNSDIRLYKLELPSGSIDDVVIGGKDLKKTYNFEITNMSDSDIAPAPDATAANGQQPGAPAATTPGQPAAPGQTTTPPGAPGAPGAATPDKTGAAATSKKAAPAKSLPTQPIRIGRPLFGTGDSSSSPSSQGGPGNNGNLPPNLKKIEKF